MPAELIEIELACQRAGHEGDARARCTRSAAATGFLREPDRFRPDKLLAQFLDATWWYVLDEEIAAAARDRHRGDDRDVATRARRTSGRCATRRCPPTTCSAAASRCSRWPCSSQLRAPANWHRIAREWMYGDEPVTELGREEAEFYGDGVVRRPPATSALRSGAGSSCPGLPEGRPAVMPTRSPACTQPSSTTRARGGRDQLLGDLVAAHRGRLHAPHQPAAADGLAAGRERVDRHGRAGGRRSAAPSGRAASGRRARRGPARAPPRRRCRRACRPGRGGRAARASRSTRGRAASARCARRSTASIATDSDRVVRRRRSPARASPRRCRRGSRWRRRSPRRASGATSATIESSICVAVIDGRASAPASASTCFCTIGTSSIRISMPRSPRATITQSAARTISSARCDGLRLLDLGDQRQPRVLAQERDVLGAAHEATAPRGRRRSPRRSRTCSRSSSGTDGSAAASPGMLRPWREATAPPTSTSASISPSPGARGRHAQAHGAVGQVHDLVVVRRCRPGRPR